MTVASDLAHEKSVALRASLEGAGRAEAACWLSDDILLVTGWFHAEPGHAVEACLVSGDKLLPLEARLFSYSRPDVRLAGSDAGKVLTLRLLRPEDAMENLGRLVIKTGGKTFSPLPVNLSEVVTDVHHLLHSHLAGLPAGVRLEALRFLADTLSGHLGTTNALRLGQSLLVVRDALRERLPSFEVVPEQRRCMCIDHLVAINETSFYIRGWVHDPESKLARLSVVSPEGHTVEIHDRAFFVPRPDLDQFFKVSGESARPSKNGFACYFTTPAPSVADCGWLAQARNAKGEAMEAGSPQVVQEPEMVRKLILKDLEEFRQTRDEFLTDHVHPALSESQRQHHASVEVERVEQYGEPNASPKVSIIVPLYKRIDFLEHQLAQFAHDPEIIESDLIYVLDSPELAHTLSQLAYDLFPLYNISFRLVILKKNYGYSTANNVGASLARAPLLLLLNSDVLPDKPGWLGRMCKFYDSMPGIGALGPKLLFEDDGLQHAGMYFERHDNFGFWTNQHYFKGYERHLPAANRPRPVPAVTGACLMVATALYQGLGGLSGTYLQGDFEDSDFCLRLIKSGRKNWYLPFVELYHLEGQSYPSPMRQLTWIYNAWVHSSLWDDLIDELMPHYPSRFNNPSHLDEGLQAFTQSLLTASRTTNNKNAPLLNPAAALKIFRTGNPSLVNAHLRNCAMAEGLDEMADGRIWIKNDSGAITSCRLR
ncbi:MAG: glycosyltransferase [Pyrinomonadaceae bacterium]